MTTYGNMTPDEKRAAVRRAAGQLQRELSHPAMVAAITEGLSPARVHPAGCGPDCQGWCLLDGQPCRTPKGCADCRVPDGRPCAPSCPTMAHEDYS